MLAACLQEQDAGGRGLGAVIADQLLPFEAPALVAQDLGAAGVVVSAAVPLEGLALAGAEEGGLVLTDAAVAGLFMLAVGAVGAEL